MMKFTEKYAKSLKNMFYDNSNNLKGDFLKH